MKTKTSIITKNRYRSAFSLIELIMVTIVIALMAGGVINVSAKRMRKVQVESAAKHLYLSAKYGRLFAVEKNKQCKLVLDKEGKIFFLMAQMPNEEGEIEETVLSNPYTKPYKMNESVLFESIKISPSGQTEMETNEDQPVVIFNTDGTADSTVIQLGNGNYHFCVYITAGTGRANIQEGEAQDVEIDVVDLDQML